MPEVKELRVAMIIQSYLPRLGGAEKQLAVVCRKLRQRGIEPCVITRRYMGMAPFEVIDETPVYRVPAPGPKVLAAFCYLLFGLSKIHAVKPHLIHAHELLTPTDMAVLAKRVWHVPTAVKVLRGGTLGDLDKLNHRFFGRMRIRRMVHCVDRFIAISDEIADELAAEGIDPDRCAFIPNGVDIEVYRPAAKPEKMKLRRQLGLPEGFLCVFSGRLAPEKGLKTLLSAWEKIENSYEDAYLLVLGSGPMESELRAMAVDRVIFQTNVPEPAPYYRTADAFILPSETEGLSNAMLEAMACGLAVMVTGVGAAREIITDEVNGLLLKPGSVEDILGAMERLMKEPQAVQRMGAAGRQTVERDFSLDSTIDRLVNLYAHMMEVEGC